MSKVAPHNNGSSRPRQQVVVKLQTVQIMRLDVDPTDQAQSIGKHVDNMIADSVDRGMMPNKLVLDLNPPREEDEFRMG